MNPEVIVELIKIIPSILWMLFLIILLYLFRNPIKNELLPRVSGLKAFGVELTFVREELDKAIEKQGKKVAVISMDERSRVLRRAEKVVSVLQGAQILWVDDNPDNNIYLRKIMRSLGIFVDTARSTTEGISMLQQTQYDVVISDMKRDGNPNEGIEFLDEMLLHNLYRWTIFYTGELDFSKGTPAYAFGITNRPDYLLHYVMDILERERI